LIAPGRAGPGWWGARQTAGRARDRDPTPSATAAVRSSLRRHRGRRFRRAGRWGCHPGSSIIQLLDPHGPAPLRGLGPPRRHGEHAGRRNCTSDIDINRAPALGFTDRTQLSLGELERQRGPGWCFGLGMLRSSSRRRPVRSTAPSTAPGKADGNAGRRIRPRRSGLDLDAALTGAHRGTGAGHADRGHAQGADRPRAPSPILRRVERRSSIVSPSFELCSARVMAHGDRGRGSCTSAPETFGRGALPAETDSGVAGVAHDDGRPTRSLPDEELVKAGAGRRERGAAFRRAGVRAITANRVYRLSFKILRHEGRRPRKPSRTRFSFSALPRTQRTSSPNPRFSTWLYRVATNASLMKYRKRRDHPHFVRAVAEGAQARIPEPLAIPDWSRQPLEELFGRGRPR